MTRNRQFWHKVGYASAIVLLLLPLSYLSQPETTASRGGKLAQLRKDNNLAQSDLGEIDPTSETIKLATLGMRGVAANLLWEKANYYKKVEDWTKYQAALKQITRLQPNFITVWRHLAWNLSYNVSVEFDDFRDRYHWVMEGIKFIDEGTHVNKNEPRLLWDMGWFISQKIGRADEHIEYRKLFREDDDFNADRKLADRDNWLVGREYFLRGQYVVDKLGVAIKGMTPLIFHSDPAMALINYSEAIEDEGTYGEVAKAAWKKSGDAWHEFGNRDLPTTYNVTIRLNDQERDEKRAREAAEALDKLAPGVRAKLRAERIAALPADKRGLADMPREKMTPQQYQESVQLEGPLHVSHDDVARQVEGQHHLEAMRLAEFAAQTENHAQIIDRYRQIVNFAYWRLRCEVERTGNALAARKLIYDALSLHRDANLEGAKAKYEQGLEKWRAVLDEFPALLAESTITDDLLEFIEHYRKLLGQLDQTLPEPFILDDVLHVNDKYKVKPPDETPAEPGATDKPSDDPTPPTDKPNSSGEGPSSSEAKPESKADPQ